MPNFLPSGPSHDFYDSLAEFKVFENIGVTGISDVTRRCLSQMNVFITQNKGWILSVNWCSLVNRL